MPHRMTVNELERRYDALVTELREVEQILAEVLEYPRYVDDPQNFPDATAADGYCVGEMTPALLAQQVADAYRLLAVQNTSFLAQLVAKGFEISRLTNLFNIQGDANGQSSGQS